MGLILNNYTKRCKTTLGGVKNLYLLPYVEYNRTQVRDSQMSLTVFPESTIYKFDSIGNYTQQSKSTGGAISFDQSVSVQLSEVYNVLDANAFLRSDFRVIIETNNNDILMFGAYNGMECSASNNSGTTKSEFNGFSFDFKGEEQKAGLLISSLEDFDLTISEEVYLLLEDGDNILTEDNNVILVE